MQKIELTNKQYRLLMQVVALGVDLMDNASLDVGEEGEETEDADLMEEVCDLEDYLMSQAKRFAARDIIDQDDEGEFMDYEESFKQHQNVIAHSAYFNKCAELASFQLGMRDFKKEGGEEEIQELTPQQGVDKIMPFTMKYLEEIYDNGFENFYLDEKTSAKIVTLSSE